MAEETKPDDLIGELSKISKILAVVKLFWERPIIADFFLMTAVVIALLGFLFTTTIKGIRPEKTLYNDIITNVYMLQIFEQDGSGSEGIPLPSPAIENEFSGRPASAASTIRISKQDIDDSHRILILNKQ